ncbi:unnamed protein product [Clonostachys byssicola]|uniref:Transcription factor domain-containing protein n=1 Tax=Clonostachys byssicola TaxID=160290 RepID=A0A9N9UDZ7_9HYPO|nr:unnamed protein product [Clonostachys byssicola]
MRQNTTHLFTVRQVSGMVWKQYYTPRLVVDHFCRSRKLLRCDYSANASLLAFSPQQFCPTLKTQEVCIWYLSSHSRIPLIQAVSEAAFGGTGAECLSTVTQLVCELFLDSGSGVEEVVRRYYANIHPWFPIIQEDLHYFLSSTITSLGNHGHLLLSMYLASHPLCEHVSEVAHNPLYLTTKQMFLAMQTSSIGSIRLLESGLLIAVYEFGHGLTEKAHHTASSCLAIYRNLVETQFGREPSSTEDLAEIRTCWQAIVLLDRLINFSKTINAITTTQTLFQKDSILWESIYNSSILPASTTKYQVQGTLLDMEMAASNFSMLYRVSVLLGDIFEHVAQVTAGRKPSTLYKDLEKEISLITCNMIEEAGTASIKFCEASPSLLETTQRMVLDMNRTASCILEIKDASAMSLMGIYCVCSAGVLLVLASQRVDQISLADSDMATIRSNLEALNRRWGIGGNFPMRASLLTFFGTKISLATYLQCLREDPDFDGSC